jgi:hypothetical protein
VVLSAFELSERKGKPIGLNSRLQRARSSRLHSGHVMESRKNPNRYGSLNGFGILFLKLLFQVNQVKCSRVYDASKPMRAVLDDLLDRLNDILKSQLGVEEDIRWYVFCNPFPRQHYLTFQGRKSHFLPRKMPKLEYPLSIFEQMSNSTLRQPAAGKKSLYLKGMVRKPPIMLGSSIFVLLWMRH